MLIVVYPDLLPFPTVQFPPGLDLQLPWTPRVQCEVERQVEIFNGMFMLIFSSNFYPELKFEETVQGCTDHPAPR